MVVDRIHCFLETAAHGAKIYEVAITYMKMQRGRTHYRPGEDCENSLDVSSVGLVATVLFKRDQHMFNSEHYSFP